MRAPLTPSEILLQQIAGLMYDRVPPSMTVAHPGPAPTIGLNLSFSLLHWGGNLIVTAPPSKPFSITPSVAPTQHAGFWGFNQPLPSWARPQPPNTTTSGG